MGKRPLCIILIGTMLVLSGLNGCVTKGRQKIAIDPGEKFTEEVAIRVSRQALTNAGHDISKMEPVSFREEPVQPPGENIFARNTSNPNNGYIIWRERRDGDTIHYSVQMEKVDNYVFCTIGKTH